MSASASTPVFTLKEHSDGKIKLWTLLFDLPGEKVNKFDERVMGEFETLLSDLESKSSEIDALVVLSPKKGIFIAGADIKLIQAAKTAQDAQDLAQKGQQLLNRWEDLPFKKIVAIDGACLGGGCEFSLASDVILMSTNPAAKIGLPEVNLGVLPGMGGCVRLPRKVGIATALDLILTGKMLDGKRAYKQGLIEAQLAQEDFPGNALAWVRKNYPKMKAGKRIAKKPKLGGMGGAMGSALETFGKGMIFSQAKKGVLSKTKGFYPSPIEAIKVISSVGTSYQSHPTKPNKTWRDKAMLTEAIAFGKCAETEVSKNLIRLFFITEEIKKQNGCPSNPTEKGASVQAAGVLGAGVMGGGVAQLFADKGTITHMKDLTTKALAIGMEQASKIFKKKLKRRRITKREYLQKMNLISPTLDYEGFRGTELVVEAVIEKMDIKKDVLKDLEGFVKDDCVIATNTSSLSVSEMQTALSKPERFGGMHFFNPVSRMPLIEVIRGDKTDDRAIATIFNYSKKVGKTPIVVKDAPGFLVNRLLVPYMNEAIWLLAEGAPVEEVDKALLKFGMPMGPLELIDEVGVDVGEKVLYILYEAFGERMLPAAIVKKITGSQRLGKKNKKGIYQYSGSGIKLQKTMDPEIYNIVGTKPKPGHFKPQEIVERCILPIINEASRCLEENVVETAQDVDIGMIFGTGFPPFRGGPMRYADTLGASHLVERLKHYHQKLNTPRFQPAEAMIARSSKNQQFYGDSPAPIPPKSQPRASV